jgi:DNA polymerase elongation subunit (family B)
MGFLFIDIESFVDPKDEKSGLNPFHKNSKVIVISYNYYYHSHSPSPGEIKEPEFLFEWVFGSEKKLLHEFYIKLKEWHAKDDFLKIVGFNHLAYDLPYLFSRMRANKIADEKELFNLLFTNARHIDLAQLAMPISKLTKNDRDFRCISQKAINHYFEIPVKEGNGKDLSEFYLKKEFSKKTLEFFKNFLKKLCIEKF